MTRATLAHASEFWMVALAAEKAAVIGRPAAIRHSPLPLARIVAASPRVRWFLDDAAARLDASFHQIADFGQ